MMNTYSTLIILTCVMIIIVILIADNLTTAILIVSLLINFLIIGTQFNILSLAGPISRGLLSVGVQDQPVISSNTDQLLVSEPPAETQKTDMYGPFYEMWHAYRKSYDCYDTPRLYAPNISDRNYDIDTANTLIAQQRSRDKRAMDGWAVKDANFYKHHFGSELDNAESKPWWSRNEY